MPIYSDGQAYVVIAGGTLAFMGLLLWGVHVWVQRRRP